MDRRILVYVACVVLLLQFVEVSSCPSGKKFCPDRNGCVANSQSCSDGDLLCVNMTVSCDINGTKSCLDVGNYTCGDISCLNMTKYCPSKDSCIDVDEYCCSEKEEACMYSVEYKHFFEYSTTLQSICEIFASDDGNFTANYTELKYYNPLEDKMCDNGTYFCPLVLQCISMNYSCNPDRVYNDKHTPDIVKQDCSVNESFCSLYMHCIPSTENCSYRSLFDWYENGNKSVDLYSQSCPRNKTFCPMTFNCTDKCDTQDSMNMSCDATENRECSNKECGTNDTKCKEILGPKNFTNVTDSTDSGWLETCKYRKLIKSVLWERASECKPHYEKCKTEKKECDFDLCDKLHYMNKTGWFWENKESQNNTEISIGRCKVTVNASVLTNCNLTMKPKFCHPEKLCEILKEKMEYRNMSMNESMWIEECNLTMNVSQMKDCNLTMKDKFCRPEKLCEILKEKMEYRNMSMNESMWIEECNMTMNVSQMKNCNLTMKDKFCHSEKLCEILKEKMEYRNMSMNESMWIEECNMTMNVSQMKNCNLTMKPKSCRIRELCDDLEYEISEYEKGNMTNNTVMVDNCNITMNEHVYKMCKKNRSCELHTLCKPLKEYNYNHSKVNKKIHVEGCDVVFNQTVMDVCNISFRYCKIEDLCPKYRELAVNHTKQSFPKMVDNCKVDWKELEQCNITLRKNDTDCDIKKLCKPIKEHNFNSSMVNKTIHIEKCEITFNKTVLTLCNITFEASCKVEDLCPKYRALGLNHTIYNFPKYVGKCRVIMNDFDLCNVTLKELSDYRYEMFNNGFKISDSVKKTVKYIAVRGVGMAAEYGHWEYQNAGVWTRLGPVSSEGAIVLSSSIRLRFMLNYSSWHGVATLMYTPLKRGVTGSHVDVSENLHEPQNTLALLQYPSYPIANVTRFIGGIYTVDEDEEDSGFMIDEKLDMTLSHRVMNKTMVGNMSEYFEHMDPKIVEEYNRTVKCFKEFKPAIAIINVGKATEGSWEVNQRKVSPFISKPALVAPHDILRFISAKHVHGNWSMKFVVVLYSNCSSLMKKEYFNAPLPFLHALKAVMMMQNTSKQIEKSVEESLEEMGASGTIYSLENFNGAVDRLKASESDKNQVKDIVLKAFDAVSLPHEKSRSGLPRSLEVKGKLAILNNPHIFTFKVRVNPRNDQPTIKSPQIFLPAIAYNVTINPIKGKLIKDLLTDAMASDIDEDKLGIAIVQALNTSIGSWYYKSPNGLWTQIIVDNEDYSDSLEGNVSAMVLNSSYTLKFQMHGDDILWNNLEATKKAKIVFLPWDRTDNRSIGWRNIKRPSDEVSAYGKKSVTAVVRRKGCDGREGSKGRNDQCNICGGDGSKCIGCDGVLNSGAIYDDCGNCTGGTTNVTFNVMKDCAGQCGLSFLDDCNICQLKTKVVNLTDCAGQCDGKANISCGYCVGGMSGKPLTYGQDACGICGGDNSSCLGCDGVPNSGKTQDICDKCLLPNDSRRDSECIKLKYIVPNSGPSHGGMKVIILGAGLQTYSTVRCQIIQNSTSTEIKASFDEMNGRVIQFVTPVLAPGYHNITCTFDSEDVWYNVEEKILIYNKTAITFTSINPEYIDINTATTAVITGTGFVNSSDITCLSRDGLIFKAEFLDPISVLCSIPATKKSVRLELGVSFSRGDRQLPDNLLNFTIYANASNPLSARFLNSLQGIIIMFDVAIKPKIPTSDCLKFFSSDNVISFGTSSKCVFPTIDKMIITLRGRPNITVNDTLNFKLNSITQRNQMVTKEPNEMYKNLTVAWAKSAVVPQAKLTGSSVLGICAKLNLDGSQSYGSGGRRLIFIWDVKWLDPTDHLITENATADLNRIRQYLKSLPKFQSKFEASDKTMIVLGPRYKFTLKVRNFLGVESDEASFVVERQDKTIPGLSVGSKKKRMKTALGITLDVKVLLSSCLSPGYQPTVLFEWELEAVGVDLGVVIKPRLTIRPGVLKGGQKYTITVTATMQSDPTLSTTASIELDVESTPLKAIIKGGGSLVVGEDDTFVLDASLSSDPDGSSDVASYKWQCFESDGTTPCFEPDPNNTERKRRMVIDSSAKASINVRQRLETRKEYKFKLKFTKGERNDYAFITVIVKSGAPPSAFIYPSALAKVNPTDVLIIESFISSKKTVNTTWSCVVYEGYGYVDLEESGVVSTQLFQTFTMQTKNKYIDAAPSLLINRNILEDGVTYKFKLTAQHSDSSSFADIEITTNKAPTLGTLTVEPESGFFQNTTFTIRAEEGWDDDEDDLPMKYQFGYYIKDPSSGNMREEFLNTPSEDNTFEVKILPQGNPATNYSLEIFVKVFDIYGAMTVQKGSVIVKPTPLDVSSVNKLADTVDSDFESGNFETAAAIANAIVAVFSRSYTNDPSVTKVIKEFQRIVINQVLKAIEGGGIQDKASKNVAKASLTQMTSDCQPDCDSERVAKNVAKMEGSSQSSNKRRRRAVIEDAIEEKSAADVESTLKIFENIINPDDYTNGSLKAKASFLSTLKAQEPSLCKGLATGGPYALAKSNITVMKAVKNIFETVDTKFMEVSSSTAPEYIETSVLYKLGEYLKIEYDSWSCTSDDTCTGTCIATAQFKYDLLTQNDPSESNLTRLSDIASIRLYNPQTLAEISVSNLPSPVVIRFSIKHAEMYENYTKECRLWHEGSQEWSMSGCNLSTSNNSIVECSCTHLGYITVFLGEEVAHTTRSPTTENTKASTEQPEQAVVVEFAFDADYSTVISGNITKPVFISYFRTHISKALNISQSRITNMDIRSGSIIVTFTILPGNDTSENSVNSAVVYLEQLVKMNNVNFTLPGFNETLMIITSSFKIITSPTSKPTLDNDDDDDDGLSTAEIVIIVIVCVVVLIAVIAGLVYYFIRVRPTRAGKVSPHTSHIQLNEQNNNQALNNGVENEGLVSDEKAV